MKRFGIVGILAAGLLCASASAQIPVRDISPLSQETLTLLHELHEISVMQSEATMLALVLPLVWLLVPAIWILAGAIRASYEQRKDYPHSKKGN